MPIPKKRDDEKNADFVSRCMSDSKMRDEYSYEQRLAICMKAADASIEEPGLDQQNSK